jgi:hypothetical protein
MDQQFQMKGKTKSRDHDPSVKRKRITRSQRELILKLRRAGWTWESIRHKIGCKDVRTVQTNYDKAVGEERIFQSSDYARKNHLDNMNKQADILRSCLEDNKLYLQSGYTLRKPLEINGNDWRLDPVTWVRLCTPDFSDESLWGREFPLLKAHTKGSPFWKHLSELHQKAVNLEQDYEKAAQKLVTEDDRFAAIWEVFRKRKLELLPHRPSRNPIALDDDDLSQYEPSCKPDLCEQIIDRLSKVDNKINSLDRPIELEVLLDQLNIDMVSTNIQTVIAKGWCDGCPKIVR